MREFDAPARVTRIPGWLAPGLWFLLIGALLALGPEGHPELRLSPLVLLPICLTGGVALALAWSRLMAHPAIRRLLPLLAILMVVPIQFLPAWDGVHDSVIVILPLSWAALEGNRRLVLWGVVAAVAVCFAEPLRSGYVPRSVVFDALTIAVWAGAAITLNAVVLRARRQARELTLAFTDGLTGLPNRTGWDTLLASMLDSGDAARAPLAIVLLDLDDFGAYNEDWGHRAADLELAMIGANLRRELRAPDVMARFGGDEFAVMLPESTTVDAESLVARLHAATAEAHNFAAGVAVWDGHEPSTELTVRCAAALAEAKRRPRVASEPRLALAGVAQPVWETVLPCLVRERTVESVYQPILRLSDRTIVAYEALARPAGAGADMQVDGMFATARAQGTSAELEMLCVRSAIRGSGGLPAEVDLFINIGAGALHQPREVICVLGELLHSVGRSPGSVVLEISEAVTRIGRFASAAGCFRGAGFRLALDDAGEANSAIQSLSVIQPAFIKIGRSIATSHADVGSAATIHALVQYARFAGGSVIAEGIEQDEDCHHLQALGVEYGQGFALGRPARIRALAVAAAAAD